MSYPFPWGPPPPGYVPGLGRGAVGFVSSVDHGVIKMEDETSKPRKGEQEAAAKADRFFEEIDRKMRDRNKSKKKATKQKEDERLIFDEIRDRFSDVSAGLKKISATEWANLPEIGATTYHRPKWEMLTHASNRIIAHDFGDSALNIEANADDASAAVMGQSSALPKEEEQILSVANAQRSVLSVQLSRVLQENSQINCSSFYSEMDSQADSIISQIDDLERASSLYRSMTHSDPKNAKSWILRSRVEGRRGRLQNARKVALEGLSFNPESEMLVAEVARLSTKHDAISILQSSLKCNLRCSEKLWLQLVAYMDTVDSKKTVLEEALSALPKSALLWMAAAALADEKGTSILKRSVGYVTENLDLWKEGCLSSPSYEDAKFFADGAIKSVGETSEILVLLAFVEEKFGHPEREICEKAVRKDESRNWIEEAKKAEEAGFKKCALDIVEIAKFSGEFLQKAEEQEAKGLLVTAKALYLRVAKETCNWRPYIEFERKYGDAFRAAKEAIKQSQGNEEVIEGLVEIVGHEAIIEDIEEWSQAHPDSEKLAIEMMEAYIKTGQLSKAAEFGKKASERIHSSNVFMKYAEVVGLISDPTHILEDGTKLYPQEPMFWVLLAEKLADPMSILRKAIQACPNSAPIHLKVIEAAISQRIPAPRIRVLFERARKVCPDSRELREAEGKFETDVKM